VPNNEFGTREVSNGSLKLKVVNIGEKRTSNNFDKHGKQQPDTQFVAGRICSKNRKEFVKGKWTARLKLWGNGEPGMFPAWWILGARNNEPPVQEPDENIPWPLTGSGEIDIFEHHGESGRDRFTTGAIRAVERDKGDWSTLRTSVPVTLNDYHEYSVEWAGSDLVYRVDGVEVYRNVGEGDKYPEAMFAILNYAKISDATVDGEWVMEVDWVKHEAWDDRFLFPDPKRPALVQLVQSTKGVSLSWDSTGGSDTRYNVYRTTRSGGKAERIAYQLEESRFEDAAPGEGQTYYYAVSASVGCVESPRSEVVHTSLPYVAVPARIEAEDFVSMNGIKAEDCGDTGGGLNLGYFDPGDFIEFNIVVERAGDFTLEYRLASQTGSRGFEVLIDDQVVDTQALVPTGGWQSYVTITSRPVALSQGKHKLRLRSIGQEWNINWLELTQR
jgi:beta-glucanase (GH16 family)